MALTLALGGCIEARSRVCASGVICPAGKRCDDINHGCVGLDEGICGDGVIEGEEACDSGPANDDHTPDACRVTCRLPSCGDGQVDTGEVCDDGNREDGDGCSSNCQSTEECGNGRVDAVEFEGCDDGNLRSFDGCSSACTAEVPIWEPMPVASLPPRRSLALMAADHDRGRVFMYGGRDANGSALDDLWEYDGTAWRLRSTGGAPPAQALVAAGYIAGMTGTPYPVGHGGALIYEAAAARLMLVVDDATWTYDESNGWQHLADEGGSGPNFALAYNTGDGRPLLYRTTMDLKNNLPRGETLFYDGAAWQPLGPEHIPGALIAPTMGYHEGLQRMVLLGYRTDAAGQPLELETWHIIAGPNNTWVRFEGSPPPGGAWTLVPTAGGLHLWPGTTVDSIGAYVEGGLGTGFERLWRFESGGWESDLLATQLPRARTGAAVAEVAGHALLFGGMSEQWEPLAESWEYHHGQGWRQATDDGLPTPRRGAGLAHDPERGRTVLFGGAAVLGAPRGTWEFDGEVWRVQQRLEDAPSTRDYLAMGWDGAASRVVLFGGGHVPGQAAPSHETWTYGEDGWRAMDGGTPNDRATMHQIVYDAARQRLVSFGGTKRSAGDPVPEHRTRELVNGRWVAVETERAPLPRVLHAMAYDPIRERVVLFGGLAPTLDGSGLDPTALAETWEYDGANWALVKVAQAPSARVGAALTWNEPRGRLVLHGGEPARGEAALSDTWEYDGRSWYPVATATRGPEVADHQMVYDTEARALVLVGEPTTGASAWTFSVRGSVAVERCDNGVDDDDDEWSDCDDPDCNGTAFCPVRERCDNGVDDDGDGKVDCRDPNCGGLACGAQGQTCVASACTCVGGAAETACSDGVDDDCDGRFDCDDPDCADECLSVTGQ